jgi:ankyrin repeat protein
MDETPDETVLTLAVNRHDAAAVRALLLAGADPDEENAFGVSPLRLACVHKNIAILKLLLEAGAHPNGLYGTNAGPLNEACGCAWAPGIRLLLDSGANIGVPPQGGADPEMYTACTVGTPEVVAMLLRAGADKDRIADWSYCKNHVPLVDAVKNPAIVEILLHAGADVNRADDIGETPLHKASHLGCARTVKILLAAGARIATYNRFGCSPVGDAKTAEIRQFILDRLRFDRQSAAVFYRGLHGRLGRDSPIGLLAGFSWITRFIAVHALPPEIAEAVGMPELL